MDKVNKICMAMECKLFNINSGREAIEEEIGGLKRMILESVQVYNQTISEIERVGLSLAEVNQVHREFSPRVSRPPTSRCWRSLFAGRPS